MQYIFFILSSLTMTVIHTETHLTQDPIYNHQDKSAIFTVALSTFNIPCHIHRQENLLYLQENEVRSGDLVYLHGVFVTGTPTDDATYIKVQSILLRTHITAGKKRKLDDTNETMSNYLQSSDSSTSSISLVSLSPKKTMLASQGQYVEVDVSFSDYYFMVSGQAYCLLDSCNSYQQINGRIHKNIQEKGFFLADTLKQLHMVYNDLIVNGMNRLQVMNFVNTATIFIKTINEIKDVFPDEILPSGVTISPKVPLPSLIYNAYINDE
jgi:hypothetical protein